MSNNGSFFNSEEEKLERKLLALIKILKEDEEFTVQNTIRMKYARGFKNQELINKDGDLFLTVDSLIRINNIIAKSQNLHLRRHNVKPSGYNKQYMDVSRIEAELYSLVDKCNNRRITSRAFCNTFLDKIHPFAGEKGRTCKILFLDKIENFYKIYKKACV